MRKEYDNAYITRIGFYDKWKYEVFVVTDDEIQVPHFHVRTVESDIAIELEINRYLPHNKKESSDRMTVEAMKGLADFMAQPCRLPKFINNYELTAVMWNTQNYIQFRCKTDETGNIIIPDYSRLYSNIDREVFVMQDDGYERYDSDYIDSIKRIMNKRTWR